MWDRKSLWCDPACRGFGRPDCSLAPSNQVRRYHSAGGVSGIFRPQKKSLHAPGDRAMAGVPASFGQKGSEEHRLILFIACSSPRCFFQLRAQIQTAVQVFVRKFGF